MNTLFEVAVGVVCVTTVLVAVTFVAEFDQWRIVAWLQTPLVLWIPISLAATLIALSAGEYPIAVLLGIASAIFIMRLAPLLRSTLAPAAHGSVTPIRVAHGNLLYLNDRHTEVIRTLTVLRADVIALCEVTDAWDHAIAQHHEFSALYPHRIVATADHADGIAVYSKFEIISHQVTPMVTKNAVVATLDHPTTPFQVVTPHPMPPVSRLKTRDWRPSIELIRESISEATPALLIGDLNAAHWHPTLRRLTKGRALRHIRAGRRGRWAGGLSPSWRPHRKLPKLVRLDHAWTNCGMSATHVSSFSIPGSDHDGLLIEVVFSS